jgi:hypothetical protein
MRVSRKRRSSARVEEMTADKAAKVEDHFIFETRELRGRSFNKGQKSEV